MGDCVYDSYVEVFKASRVAFASGEARKFARVSAMVARMSGSNAFAAQLAMSDAESNQVRCVEEVACRLLCENVTCSARRVA
jgi:hypothetical protein